LAHECSKNMDDFSSDKDELELGEYRESKGPFIVSTIVKFCMVLS
jgi:hypothetical protein